MKKKGAKKLKLSAETLRTLTPLDLQNAAGGLPWTETCNCCTFSCQTRDTRCSCESTCWEP